MHTVKQFIARTWLAVFVVLAAWFAISYFHENSDALARIADADKRYLLAAAFAQILYYLATVLTWQKALRYATGKSIGFREGLAQILLVNFGKYIPGKVWGLAARGGRLKELGFSIEQTSSTSYLEQVLLVLTGLWLACLAAMVVYQNSLAALLTLAASLAILSFHSGSALAARLSKSIPGMSWLDQVFNIKVNTAQILVLTIGYLLVWSFLTMAFVFVCCSIISIDITLQSIANFLLSLTSGFLAGFFAVFAPGGVGVREGVGAAFLSSTVILDEALLLMLLFRVWIIIWELIAGAAFVLGGLRPGAAKSDPGLG